MRLDELQGVKNHVAKPFARRDDVVAYLAKQGFRVLGMGNNGAVFDHPSFRGKYVLKVFSDRYYEAFLNYCIANQGNPHLPKIVGKVMPLGGQENGRMVRIEKLWPMTEAQAEEMEMDTLIGFLIDHVIEGQKVTPRAQRTLDEWAARHNLQSFCQTVFDVAKHKPSGAEIDMDVPNFMWRGKTLVIADPYGGDRIPFLR